MTGNPKVIIEAFPGARNLITAVTLFLHSILGPGALSRALLTLPPSQLKRLIILEDYEPYLEYLRVQLPSFLPFHVIYVLFISHWPEQTLACVLCLKTASHGTRTLIW
jgi:hypothetical protein